MPVTLRLKINAAIILTCVLAAAAAGACLLTFEASRSEARLEEARVLLENIFLQKRDDLANELFARKGLALRQTLTDMLRFKDVFAVTVYDQAGAPVMTTVPTVSETPGAPEATKMTARLTDERMRALSHQPLFEQQETPEATAAKYSTKLEVIGERIGFVDIYYDLSHIREESRLTQTLFFSVILTLLVCMSLLLNTLLGQSVIRPVKRLARAMRSLGEGDIGKTVKPMGRDEIGLMTEAFNAMSTQLRQAVMSKDDYAAQLESTNKLLAAKAAELARANKRLRDLDRMKSSFLSSVSHELRTPLTSVRGFAKLIRKDYARVCDALPRPDQCDAKAVRRMDRIRQNLEIIEQESDRLTVMVNDVLDLSRIEDGRAQWRDEVLPASRPLLDAARTAQGFLAGRDEVAFVTDIPDDLPDLFVDHSRIMQVLTNLLSNAAKFTERGEIRLSALAGGTTLRIEVRDTGTGIPANERDKIFDKFHQSLKGDLLENKPRGTGLGLAICKQIVTYYKGRIWAEAAPGGGSLFIVELPLHRPEDDDARDASAAA